ncbi:electron transport protein [Paenibacillus athensensis]|uniref:Cytochrome c domain-containing protein n=1 Tax=Paenibacillus athensensis TaxID=1967502 RepID=A0A4Y8Q335_9BACL|nr:electron transport protein [Paenibacillus athensensis]MCD1259260.1 electron transport protein [Paenibacillus athensensis]
MKKAYLFLFVPLGTAILLTGVFRMLTLDYVYVPGRDKAAQTPYAADALPGIRAMSADDPPVTAEMLELGRKAFYGETFGNEVFFTDILGAFDGVLSLANIEKAILRLGGKGTTNLLVEAARTETVGGRLFRKGELIATGLDVPVGAYVPLGIKMKTERGHVSAGVGCIACHAVVDVPHGRIVEGVPNTDLDAGLLLALSSNSAAFFAHTDIGALQTFVREQARAVPLSDGRTGQLPDPDALEDAVDRAFLTWPKGSVDTTIDLRNGPVQIPDAFTLGDFPYSWSGFAAAGPFHGLVVFSSTPNAQNMDPLSQSELSQALLGIDKELYIGTILQRAANAKFRYRPDGRTRPSAFFAAVDPTPQAPGVTELVPLPPFPRASAVSSTGLLASKPGYRFGEHLLAMAAFQNTLRPPAPPVSATQAELTEGEAVFRRAGCVACHAGTFFTNNRVVPVAEIGSEAVRAAGLRNTQAQWGPAAFYDWSTTVPLPPSAQATAVSGPSPAQTAFLLAHGTQSGGYKTPSLWGLAWSAPYLHDGGVAVGPDAARQAGAPATLYGGVLPDAHNSLLALIDRELRSRVTRANAASPAAAAAHVRGIGHEFWADPQAGFTREQQEALVRYLLQIAAP